MPVLVRLLAISAFLTACRPTTPDPSEIDEDNDGFSAAEDCDDQNAAVNPGAAEVCNGIDDDCSGAVDDGATDAATWYRDGDLDGFGDPEGEVRACAAPEGFVTDNQDCNDRNDSFYPGAEESSCDDPNDYNCDGSVGAADVDGDGASACEDCDDGDATVNPSATEACDGVDNDCDGEVDEEGASGTTTWYRDGDLDGHGDADRTAAACAQPDGFVAGSGDCNDANDRYYPGAPEEDCADPNDYNCDGSSGFSDADEDGHAACEDCNDSDGAINPGAQERCDGDDNDCDGDVDEAGAEGESVWYRDSDGDDFGDPLTSARACAAPDGFVASGLDCNDTSDVAYPGAAEVCDDLDNDCDGLRDNEAEDMPTWYVDVDGDGFGNPAFSLEGCAQPPGFVADNTDCNDASALALPGGSEGCDGLDNDCNGEVDDAASDASTWYADADGDTFGDPAVTLRACSRPTGHVADDRDCDDTLAAVRPGAAEACNGVDDDCDGVVPDDEADADADGVRVCEGDCVDTDEVIFPAAPERCNGFDDNCDLSIDGEDAINKRTWYADTDNDGHGAAGTRLACDKPSGYVGLTGDCDDTDARYHPGAPLGCDGEDYDCDGVMDNDADGDGFPAQSCGGTDCDDTNPDLYPEQGGGLCASGRSCADIIDAGLDNGNGTYSIDPDGYGTGVAPFEVWCDMVGGGWTYASENTRFRIAYSGAPVTLVTPGVPTEYTFWLEGGSGGQGIPNAGGRGGRAWGSKVFAPSTSLYVYVGGKGADGGAADTGPCSTRTGGWNGGGRGSQGGTGGGGGTDVRTSLNDLNSRILVAGGGGGCGYGGSGCGYAGGDGGGLVGAQGAGNSSHVGGRGGTQTAGGVSNYQAAANGRFGAGADNVQCNDEGGGGGGWYGGAAGGQSNTTAGGGSSYHGGMDSGTGTTPGVRVGAGVAEYIFR